MAKKRLIIDIDEAVHSRLKSEAAQLGVHLGPYCASLLSQDKEKSQENIAIADVTSVATMTLDSLRKLSERFALEKPIGWEQSIRNINSEIRRRYRV